MNGNQAADIVERMCLDAGHATSSGPSPAPTVCPYHRRVATRLRNLQRDERPPLSTASVYLVVNPAQGLYATLLDETIANEQARAIKGVVAALPVSNDFRNITDEPATDDLG